MPKIILQGTPLVHHGSNETHTISHNGKDYVIPLGVETDVPQEVIDVLKDSRMLWSEVDAPADAAASQAAPQAADDDDAPEEGASDDAEEEKKKDDY